jgi:HAD superfamily hydrolase (TIGR01509 family)
VDFRSTFIGTLGRILQENGLLDKEGTFRERWQRFMFQGVENGEFVTVRKDFSRSLERVLMDLGIEGDLLEYSESVIDGLFASLRRAELYPEVSEALTRIEEVGLPWAVVSNVDEADLQALLRFHGIRPTVTVSSERVRSYKPDVGPFNLALQELELAPGEVIHIGDSPIADIVGANSAGIDAVWLNRYGEAYPEGLPGPKWEIEDMSPVPRLILEE